MKKYQGYSNQLTQNAVTPECDYLNRRAFMRGAVNGVALTGMALTSGASMAAALPPLEAEQNTSAFGQKAQQAKTTYTLDEKHNSFDEITQYNNFYELGTAKTDPYLNAAALTTNPWSIEVDGLCAKPGRLHLEDILKPHAYEERIYRLRCVEGWSMVVPWLGFALTDLLKRFEPQTDARYVAFETLYDKTNVLPGQKRAVIQWPYREGLRIDEAMHPLTFMAVGLYGKELPNQNGAPIRLVVPWKYGFKSIKSIVKISFVKNQPKTSWNMLQPSEYGFYSNVNPQVDHTRWSQARERRIGELFKRDTLLFNGYQNEVASLYKNIDLKKYF